MAVPTNTFQTVNAVGNREDLGGIITNIAPADTLFYSSLRSTKVTAKKHEWLTDTLPAAGSNARIEGDDAGNATAVTPRVRLYNYTQIQDKVFQISSSQELVDKAGVDSEIDYQTTNIFMPALAKDVEYAFTREVLAQDDGNATAGKMRGALNWTQSNLDKAADATLNADGTVTGGSARGLTKDMVKGQMQNAFTAGGKPENILCGPFQATQFNYFQQSNDFSRRIVDGKMTDYVDIYQTEFGNISVKPHRNFPTDVVFGYDKRYWKKATLDAEHRVELAKSSALNRKFHIVVEHTLEANAEAANFRITNLTTS